MAKIETSDCAECRVPFARRDFLRVTAAGVAVSAVGVPVVRAAVPPRAKPAEDLVRELFATLVSDQKKRLVLDYDHGGKGNPTRRRTANSPLLGVRIGD